MPLIVPTITAQTLEDYSKQLENISFAERIHVDVSDGIFSPTQTVPLANAYWHEDQAADIHMMVENPLLHVETLISMNPSLIILHAESAEVFSTITELQKFNIPVGLALLAKTELHMIEEALPQLNHVLIFGGKLGFQGGQADLSQLKKVEQIRRMHPEIEIGWDGGANAQTISEILAAGVDVVNVGSAIQKADNSKDAYDTLMREIS